MQKTFVRILFYGALVLGTVNGHSLKAGPFEDGIAAIQGGDIETAYKILRPLAEQGHAPAQGILGILYHDGRVVKQDHKEAVKWYRKAAEGGDMRARTNLAVMYMRGHGTEQNYTEAVKWLRLSAEQGDRTAYANLGEIYGRGLGAPADYIQALYWYQLAALKGVRAEYLAPREFLKSQTIAKEQAIAFEAAQKCQALRYIGCTPPESSGLAAVNAKMTANAVQQELIVSQKVAPAISLLQQCGRPDVVEKFVAQQDEVLSECEATTAQIRQVKAPFSIAYKFDGCSEVQAAVESIDSTIASRLEWISGILALKKYSKFLTCEAESQ